MAVPKKRTGHSAQGHRRSNWKATKTEITTCPTCGDKHLTHTVCTSCGHYKGEPVRLKDKAELTVKETKKPAKKSAKKATKSEVTEAVEAIEATVEEVKAIETVEETEEVKVETAEIETEKVEEEPEATEE